MYRGFNLKISHEESSALNNSCLDDGIQFAKAQANEMEPMLDEITSDNIIDGDQLSEAWFTNISSDVFISYSHNDEKLALTFAGWLRKSFNLDVFLDTCVWGSADRLLKIIDEKYSKSPAGTYEYRKRNLSTSHVHAMLCTAIMRVMDSSEAVFFLNTDESVPYFIETSNGNKEYTMSPWLYTETTMASLLRIKELREYREQLIFEHSATSRISERKLNIKYKIPTERLTTINCSCLNDWYDAYNNPITAYNGMFDYNFAHPLNYLYDVVFGMEK